MNDELHNVIAAGNNRAETGYFYYELSVIGTDHGVPRLPAHIRRIAIDVSSVHSPGLRSNGPPPPISVIGSKLPRGRNSRDVPIASPTAKPSRHPAKQFDSLIGSIPYWNHAVQEIEHTSSTSKQHPACAMQAAKKFTRVKSRKQVGSGRNGSAAQRENSRGMKGGISR